METITVFDLKIQRELDQTGFTIIPAFVQDEQIVSLTDYFYATREENKVDVDFYTTHWSPVKEYRSKVNEQVQGQLKAAANRFFGNYKCIFGYYLYKKPSPVSDIGVHQDWSLIDEERFTGYIIWIALANTDVSNGCFHVLPGSHLVYNNVRGSHIEQHYGDIDMEKLQALELKAGDAIVMDQRLVHASPPNFSGKDRLAVGLVIVPEEAPLLHYYYNRNMGAREVYKVKDSFLVDTFYDYKHQLKDDYILTAL